MAATWSPIAIVGLGGVFPDAADPRALWDRVLAGHSAAAEVPAERWALSPADATPASVACRTGWPRCGLAW